MDVQRLSHIKRINVIGTSGSGKSTFGRRLAGSLELPFFEMDQVYWRPNWQQPTDAEFIPQIQRITEQPRWVLDGNYSRTTAVKWRHVQLVVWLDMPFARTVFRVTSRCLKRSLTQTEVWPGTGNRETLRKSFLSRESVVLWAITSYRRNRQRYRDMMASPKCSHIRFVRLTSPASSESFLKAAHAAAEQNEAPAPDQERSGK